MSQSNKDDSNYSYLSLIKDLWQHTRGYNRRIAFWYLVRVFTVIQLLLSPLIVAAIINELTSNNLFSNKIIWYVVLLSVNTLSRASFHTICSVNIQALSSQIRLEIRQRALSKFINFDLDWHESESSGKKVTVISKGADSAQKLIQFFGNSGGGVDIFVRIFGVLIYLSFLQPIYFMLATLNIFLYLFINQKQNNILLKKWHGLNKESEIVAGKNYDFFSNIGLIKRLGIGQQVNRTLFEKELEFTNQGIAISRLGGRKWMTINAVSQISQSLAIVLIITDIVSGKIPVGTFFVISGYFASIAESLGNFATQIDGVIENKLGFLRLIQLSSSGTTKTDIGNINSPDKPSILCQNVSFRYPKNKSYIIKDLNLEIPSGQKIGLVGESGSGKSTFTKLLLRLYLLNLGNILFNKTNINNIKTEDLRQQFAVVPQESEVFNLTFKENIIIASDKTKFDANLYQQAIEIAQCQVILDKIKNNHQTVLGEKGVKLSGGERQRLGIARAIYKNSPIMIFDESTSSLDSKTEEKILNNIEKNLQDKTIIWIAHRLSTLRFTERIIVFENGNIVEDGIFNNLVDKKGLFYQLWQIQQRSQLKSL